MPLIESLNKDVHNHAPKCLVSALSPYLLSKLINFMA
jgi:hypothetical protein